MNLLALVQDLARQSGTLAGGTTIASVSGVSGRAEKMVNWVVSAWTDLQNQREWNWLRADFSFELLADTARYTADSMNLERFGNWLEDTRYFQPMTLYDGDIGQSDEQALTLISYQTWKVKWGRQTHDSDRPTEWAVSPANEFLLGSTPSKAYQLRGEYRKSPQTLADNTDIPEAPERYHKAIVYRAMQLMAESDESVPTLQMADREYTKLFTNMCNDRTCLPQVSVMADGPLA